MMVRETNLQDLARVIEIEQDEDNVNWICPTSIQGHRNFIHSDSEYHFVIENRGEILGFFILVENEEGNDNIELKRIVINVKGRGYGRQVLRWVKRWAFERRKADKLWLDVFEHNTRARYLYDSEGFKEEAKDQENSNQSEMNKSLVIMSILKNDYDRQK